MCVCSCLDCVGLFSEGKKVVMFDFLFSNYYG